jgi:hypothetical protein
VNGGSLFPGDVAHVRRGTLHAAAVADSPDAAEFAVRSRMIRARERLALSNTSTSLAKSVGDLEGRSIPHALPSAPHAPVSPIAEGPQARATVRSIRSVTDAGVSMDEEWPARLNTTSSESLIAA